MARPPHPNEKMVLLLGNYPPDQQQSMQRFTATMFRGLSERGIDAEVIAPQPVFGNAAGPGGFVGKWLGYIDKYLLFPFRLRSRLRRHPAVVHICDHSNAVYVQHCDDIPVVVTCHDLLAVRGALGEETYCPASLTGRILQKWILRGLGRAQAVACSSEATAIDARRLIDGADPPQISVISLGQNYPYKRISTELARARLKELNVVRLDRPFVLHVGSNLVRKNRDGVLRIFALTRNDWAGDLVFVGEALTEEMRRLATKLGIADRVREVPNSSDAVLEALYSCAVALLYPSRSEGFGWPVIEAQACGCPVICSTVGPLPDVAGDAGLSHEVDDEAGFATDLLRLTDEAEWKMWSEKSLRNAQRCSTSRMINDYAELYDRLGQRS